MNIPSKGSARVKKGLKTPFIIHLNIGIYLKRIYIYLAGFSFSPVNLVRH